MKKLAMFFAALLCISGIVSTANAIILNIDAAEHMGVVEALSHGPHADMRNSCPPQPVAPR